MPKSQRIIIELMNTEKQSEVGKKTPSFTPKVLKVNEPTVINNAPKKPIIIPVLLPIEISSESFTKNTNLPKVNNDFLGVYSGKYGSIYVISSGSGQNGSEILAHLAVIAVKEYFKKDAIVTGATVIKRAVQFAKNEILSYINKHDWMKNCDVSIALLLSSPDGVFIAHVGDCKILLLRNKTVSSLTDSKMDNSTLIESMGLVFTEPEIIENVNLYKHDKVLLITKGVYQRVTRQEIFKSFRSGDLSNGIKVLWEYAKDKKSKADFTLIALNITNAPVLKRDKVVINKDVMSLIFHSILFSSCFILFIMTVFPYIKDFISWIYGS